MKGKVDTAPFPPIFRQFRCLSVSLVSHCLSSLLYCSRFRVIVEILKPEKTDLSVTLKGLDYIDVLSGSKKDYKLNFFSYKEGLYTAKVLPRPRRLPKTRKFGPGMLENSRCCPPGMVPVPHRVHYVLCCLIQSFI